MRRYTLQVGDRTVVVDVAEQGAERFRVTVNGQTYEVALRSVEAEAQPAVTPMVYGFIAGASSAADERAPAPPPVELPPAPAPSATPGLLAAPMPGTVLAVAVTPGQQVRRGDPLLTLEAMKMQNIIRAPADSIVAEVLVAPGRSVGFGEGLLRFETGAV